MSATWPPSAIAASRTATRSAITGKDWRMLADMRKRWQAKRHRARTRRAVAGMPDHLLRDIGLAPDDRGRRVLDHLLRTGP
ncbi:MAG: DUF1127 domain-containing protein [Albidovulum sp.]|nr:MAG: DUF1127 domain-containing protein [Defluviimonas sp.]